MKLKEYILKILREEKIDQYDEVIVNDGISEYKISINIVIEFINGLTEKEKRIIRAKLLLIRYESGEFKKFFQYIANGMVKYY